MRASRLTLLIAPLLPLLANAQTTITGESLCGKPSVEQRIIVESQPGVSFYVRQGLCTFPKATPMNGIVQVEETLNGVAEISGGVSHWVGRNTVKMANGDRVFVRLDCTSKVAKNGAETDGQCKFTYTGGTGLFKTISGGGTAAQKKTDPNAPWAWTATYTLK